jgi:hypothetical protein
MHPRVHRTFLNTGNYKIVAQKPGNLPTEAPGVQLVPGHQHATIDFRMELGRSNLETVHPDGVTTVELKNSERQSVGSAMISEEEVARA